MSYFFPERTHPFNHSTGPFGASVYHQGTKDIDLVAHGRRRVVLGGWNLQKLEGNRGMHRPRGVMTREDLPLLARHRMEYPLVN